MRILIVLIFTMLFLGCKSQKYQLENNPKISLKEGTFKETPPAIIDEKGSVSVTLKLNKFNKEEIELIGFYFRNHYFSVDNMIEPYTVRGGFTVGDKNSEEKIPFEIISSEVVIAYKTNKKLKHAKFPLKRIESFDNIPR